MTFNIQHDLEDDHSGLVAWVDGRGQFFAVGDDNVVREYGDDDEGRLRADIQLPAASPVARHVALMRQDWRDAEDAEISHLPEAEQDAAFDRAGTALDNLVGTRAADLTILAEKMRIMDKTGTVLATGHFEDLLDDVDELAKRAVIVPTKADIFAAIKRVLTKIQPWYDWSRREVSRLDTKCRHFTDESWGEVRRFEVQFLGIHFAIELGRTPPKVSAVEAAGRRERYDRLRGRA